jgi:membrane protein YqaA with SNARE-associated domain
VVLVGIAAAVAATGPFREAVLSIDCLGRAVIQQHAVAGAIVFISLAALSAIVFFFLTAVITPLAVDAFGPIPALLMLCLGWVLGGTTAYAIGRHFGRRVVSWFVNPVRLSDYEHRAKRLASFGHILLSSSPFRRRSPVTFAASPAAGSALSSSPWPSASCHSPSAAIFLGESFLERNYLLPLAVGTRGSRSAGHVSSRIQGTWAADGQPHGEVETMA